MVLALVLAAALQSSDSTVVEDVVVRNRLFTVSDRFELGLNLGASVLTQLTEHYTVNVAFSWNFAETFALEVLAGGSYSRHTGLANQVARNFNMSNVKITDDMSGLWEMVANATVGLRWQFLYGKVNVLGAPVHFQPYVTAGVGAGYFRRESVVICTSTSTGRLGGDCLSYMQESKPGPLATAALGARVFLPTIGNHHSVRLEVRDFVYLDSWLDNISRESALTPFGPIGTPRTGIINQVQFQLGYAYMF